ncbi:MAG: hypothetical protein GC201_06365 [Alphaproteobacteria bacterium]|nr:hypothetical protein [Alphaproteobacteria bacterium]
MLTISRTLKRSTLATLLAAGALAGSITAAQAHYYTQQCDRDGDDCVVLRCDNDGDDCRVVDHRHYRHVYRDDYRRAPYYRGYDRGYGPNGVYFGFSTGPRYGHGWDRGDYDDDD